MRKLEEDDWANNDMYTLRINRIAIKDL
jgi:hypothetical protein